VTIILIKFFLQRLSTFSKRPLFFLASLLILSACQTAVLQPQLANTQEKLSVNVTAKNIPNEVVDTSVTNQVISVAPLTTAVDADVDAANTPKANPKTLITAQAIAEKIVNENTLGWSELDTEASTTAAAQLLAQVQEKANEVTLEKTIVEVVPEPLPNLDLWQITVANYDLDAVDNARIDQHYNWFKSHKEYMHRVTTRASRYYHFMLHQALDKSLPTEIALLPIIESGFDPFAYSSGRASGAWQFIPATGLGFGLKQNWWYDGRRDIVASTQAAHLYLTQLHKMFDGDWLLAIASYNGGQGTVLKAIKRNKKAGKPTDFWSLDLPKETMNYVPKLLALSRIIAEQAGTDALYSILDKAYFESVSVGSQIDLAQAAEMANITTDEIYRLNPAFNQWATDPQGPHDLLIPVAHVETFKASLLEKSGVATIYHCARG